MPADIEAEVQRFLHSEHLPALREQLGDGDYRATVGKLDPRLRLADCSTLQSEVHGQKNDYGRLSVKVRCSEGANWSLYVNAEINVFINVAVSTHPLRRGQRVTNGDITFSQQDISQLRDNFYTDAEQVVGLELTRSIGANQVLRSSQLKPPLAVKRGDKVLITAENNKITIKMNGIALSNGEIGQQIRVRNSSSDRIIRARVTAPGEVSVIF